MAKFFIIPMLLIFGMLQVHSAQFDESTCSYNGQTLYGNVKVVNQGIADYTVRVLDYGIPDLVVHRVEIGTPLSCGEWKFIDYGIPDFTVKFSKYEMPDFTIKIQNW